MEISVIASGSNGNCCLVENNGTSILIDAGKSVREIRRRIDHLGKSLKDVNAVILTHGHIDHYCGIGALSRMYRIPVYLTQEVYSACRRQLGFINYKHFSLDKKFRIGSMDIKPITTSHDVSSCGFVIKDFGFFTDTGTVTLPMQLVAKKLKGLLIESNHDIDMLINGKYPPFLKQRIMSNHGHLSNVHASSFVKGLNLNWVLLAHLSANNNTPQLAQQTFESIVKKKVEYSVLSRDRESGTWLL